ncbi:unnamed protein product [Adineta steineri]|uniref:G-protein coupled receptors family 1 profile domain-containing protein n=2 Tax=Adineta steineri TaxID=433720 RepID=A0A819HL15_9BILA|nr:unnamed protein product [Adineta steineri]CAF3905540.1 unnamed protein product [Adineta steineri]
MSNNNSLSTNIESWFIPIDILNIICLSSAIILVLIYLIIIIFDKTCHTVPMLLVANSCLAELLLSSNIFWVAIFTLQNDLKRQAYEDPFCIFRGYIGYVACCAQNYSYFLQAIYRYLKVIYPTRLFWQSKRVQIFLIIFVWIVSFTFAFPHIFTGAITYLVDNQMCQMPLHFSILAVYNTFFLYIIPMNCIIFIYFKLVRYVKEMSQHVTPANTLIRAQRELKMVYRIVMLVMILVALGFPYTIFIFMGFFTSPPKYHFRIAYIFVDVSLVFIMVIIFHSTEPLKASVKNRITKRQTTMIQALR